MGILNADAVFLDTSRGSFRFADIYEMAALYRQRLAEVPKRSLIITIGQTPEKLWALILAAWELDLCVLPLARGISLPKLSYALLIDGEEWLFQKESSASAHVGDLYILTSGSTGVPKAVAHNKDGLIASALATIAFYELSREDSWLLSLDAGHIGGFQILLRMWLLGGKVFVRGLPKDLRQELPTVKPSLLSLVPTQLFDLIEEKSCVEVLKQCKLILLGGAATQSSLLERIKDLSLPISITYGSSETASQIAAFRVGVFPKSADEVGEILPCFHIEKRETGLAVEGKPLFLGYRVTHEWFPRPSPFFLPDEGEIIGNRLFISGRRDQIFQVGGENFSPSELTRELEDAFPLGNLIVLKVIDERFGFVPHLYVRAQEKPDLRLILERMNRLKPIFRPRVIGWFQSPDTSKWSKAALEQSLTQSDSSLIRLWTYEHI